MYVVITVPSRGVCFGTGLNVLMVPSGLAQVIFTAPGETLEDMELHVNNSPHIKFLLPAIFIVSDPTVKVLEPVGINTYYQLSQRKETREPREVSFDTYAEAIKYSLIKPTNGHSQYPLQSSRLQPDANCTDGQLRTSNVSNIENHVFRASTFSQQTKLTK
ncbi:hypothetical protein J6590_087750 [Homalodisca vitripennis]|nr:hypothetical protein J6590_087750 [Homalodisca vitripennis]